MFMWFAQVIVQIFSENVERGKSIMAHYRNCCLSLLLFGSLFGHAIAGPDETSPATPASQFYPGNPELVKQLRANSSNSATKSVANRYIVIFKDSNFKQLRRKGRELEAEVEAESDSVAKQHGASRIRKWSHAFRGMYVEMNAQTAAAMKKNPRVLQVEQDKVIRINDTQTGPAWGLDRIDQRNLALDATYGYTNTGNTVTAYVIDTGIRTSHQEFGARASWGINTSNDGKDTDCNGHGTHVAGTIGSSTYGVAKQVNLVAVKVLDCNGSGYNSTVISGIDWVIANKRSPAVINMSLGGSFDTALNSALTNATNAGISVVVAAGNESRDACLSSPASAASAITVGATNSDDSVAYYSNLGSCVDLFAPGSGITSTWMTSDAAINTISGTSMASPHVAGAVALYLEGNPSASPATVASVITGSATPGVVVGLGANSPNKLLYTKFGNSFGLNVSKFGGGTITSSPPGINCGITCNAIFDANSSVTLEATPASGWDFSNWSGACSGQNCMLVMDSNKTATATFANLNGNSEIFPEGSGVLPSGWIASSGSAKPWSVATAPVAEGLYSARSGAALLDNQTSGLEVSAIFQTGNVSFDWNVSSEANFDWLNFYVDGVLRNRISGCSGVTTCWNSQSFALSAGPHTLKWTYTKDMSVASGQDAGWIDNVVLPAITGYSLGVSTSGSGTVTGSPSGINCGATCSYGFATGTTVTLSATPASGYFFTGWSGACSGTGPCSIAMNSNKNVSANFAVLTNNRLSVTKSGKGTVNSSPAGINCGSTCSFSYPSNTSVTLTATPSKGYVFAGWSGSCSGTGACIVAMSTNNSVTANFLKTNKLSLSKKNYRYGSVYSTPAGIVCETSCASSSASYANNTSVVLTASPVSGRRFSGWSGACSSTSNTCTVSMSTSRKVTAKFE